MRKRFLPAELFSLAYMNEKANRVADFLTAYSGGLRPVCLCTERFHRAPQRVRVV